MTRLWLVVLVAGSAWADVAPFRPPCTPPATCRPCGIAPGEEAAASACIESALDAGLAKVQCTDRMGAWVTEYYCPPGTIVGRPAAVEPSRTRTCGCAAVDGPFVLGLLALFAARRRVGRS
jgi:hypothetical protein